MNETNHPEASKHPNILLVITDQQSADAIGCQLDCSWRQYLNTPNMDRLCTEGVFFNNAYCADPLCVPSRTSMLSGRYPHETGVVDNSPDETSRERIHSFPTLGTVFRHAGYRTGYIGKFHTPYDPAEEFEFTADIRNNGADAQIPEPTAAFLDEQKNAEIPFFLVTSFVNPHNICEWARGDRGEDLPDDPIENPDLEECPPLRSNHLPAENEPQIMTWLRRSYHATKMTPVADFSEADWRRLQFGYYRMIEMVDRRLGEIMESLRETGQEDNTLVVFVSDHGDGQGAHKWNQKTVFYDESCRVPFAFYWPGKIEPGSRDQLAQTGIDLMPTLCGLAGIASPERLPGKDLSGVITRNEADGREYIVASTHFIQGEPIDGVNHNPNGRMVRSRQYKYCIYDVGEDSEELYDMHNDPGEMNNLAANPDYRGILHEHREYLIEYCRAHQDEFSAVGILSTLKTS